MKRSSGSKAWRHEPCHRAQDRRCGTGTPWRKERTHRFSVIEVKEYRCAPVLVRGRYPVRVALQYISCQAALPVFRCHDLLVRGALLGKRQRFPGVRDAYIEAEFVEACCNFERPL